MAFWGICAGSLLSWAGLGLRGLPALPPIPTRRRLGPFGPARLWVGIGAPVGPGLECRHSPSPFPPSSGEPLELEGGNPAGAALRVRDSLRGVLCVIFWRWCDKLKRPPRPPLKNPAGAGGGFFFRLAYAHKSDGYPRRPIINGGC
jgi:hypothetical protein